MKRIKDTFEEQEQLSRTRFMKHGQEVVRLLTESRWAYWLTAFGIAGVVATLASTFVVCKVGKDAAWIKIFKEIEASTKTTTTEESVRGFF